MKDKNREKSPETTEDDVAELTEARTRSLLELCMSTATAPVEELLVRLCTPEGRLWFTDVMEGGLGGWIDRASRLRDPTIGGEEIVALKEAAKTRARSAADVDARETATLAYLLAVAAGAAYQGKLLSDRKKEEFEGVFSEMAEALPLPWAELFGRAAAALRAL